MGVLHLGSHAGDLLLAAGHLLPVATLHAILLARELLVAGHHLVAVLLAGELLLAGHLIPAVIPGCCAALSIGTLTAGHLLLAGELLLTRHLVLAVIPGRSAALSIGTLIAWHLLLIGELLLVLIALHAGALVLLATTLLAAHLAREVVLLARHLLLPG